MLVSPYVSSFASEAPHMIFSAQSVAKDAQEIMTKYIGEVQEDIANCNLAIESLQTASSDEERKNILIGLRIFLDYFDGSMSSSSMLQNYLMWISRNLDDTGKVWLSGKIDARTNLAKGVRGYLRRSLDNIIGFDDVSNDLPELDNAGDIISQYVQLLEADKAILEQIKVAFDNGAVASALD